MAGPTRLELATSCVTGRRSNRTELRPREWMLKNAHLRRQDLKFELQRTTQYASAQISSPSLHLGIFERQLLNYRLRLISCVTLLTASSRGNAPMSPSLRILTATLRDSVSLPPIINIYGIFSNCASRILCPIFSFLLSVSTRTPALSKLCLTSSAYSFCLSVIGRTLTCTGDSHNGNAPA